MSSTALNPASLINTANTATAYTNAYPNSSPYVTVAANYLPACPGAGTQGGATTGNLKGPFVPSLGPYNPAGAANLAVAATTALNPASSTTVSNSVAGTGTLGTFNGPSELPTLGVGGTGGTL